ncbi:hypothetical protein BJ912DRAFT_30614 [Pholiota molesta]|nr:hypothetical protein BJ912DRAFT_30614 [Pholiota molesta]
MQSTPRVRRGYWNRRGDHLTPEGYIVYAPLNMAYPAELVAYPSEEEGYRNHDGVLCQWAERPELLESLPRRGRAPERPYDGFVVYVDRSGIESLAQYESTSSSTNSLPSDLLSEHISKRHKTAHDNVFPLLHQP